MFFCTVVFPFADEYVCTPGGGDSSGTDTGKWRLLIIWLFSGIFGGLISACYALRESEQIVISVGASGAIMGIAGAAIATQLASGAGTHHKNQRRVFPLLGMVALTLLYGTRQTGIDNACHIGGLIAGARWVG